jgi:hypothetical protein
VTAGHLYILRIVHVEVTPAQAPEIEAAIAAVVAPGGPAAPDPWWQAGIDDALGDVPDGAALPFNG